MRYLRLDDFPFCRPDYPERSWVHDRFAELCCVLNRNKTVFILGVVPASLNNRDIELLNNLLPQGNGKAVMHGFTHGFDRMLEIDGRHAEGGEFAGMTTKQLNDDYYKSCDILTSLECFNRDHFIAPFNAYNQSLVDALQYTGVKYLHTADREYVKYGYDKFNYGRIESVVSLYGKTYDHIWKVIINDDRTSQICLHWMIDAQQDKNWLENYETLSGRI